MGFGRVYLSEQTCNLHGNHGHLNLLHDVHGYDTVETFCNNNYGGSGAGHSRTTIGWSGGEVFGVPWAWGTIGGSYYFFNVDWMQDPFWNPGVDALGWYELILPGVNRYGITIGRNAAFAGMFDPAYRSLYSHHDFIDNPY